VNTQFKEGGIVNLINLLLIQQTLFTAEENRVTARLARLQAVLSLYQALGGSWLPMGAEAGTEARIKTSR
jgi:outer membrane protein TolC